jgi:hypothetical protein
MEGSRSPSQLEVTYAGRSCSDEPVGGPPTAQGRFGQRPPTEDPVCSGSMSRCGEGAICVGDGGGKVAPHSTTPSPEDADLEEASVPRIFAAHSMACQSLCLSPPVPTFPH